MSFIINEILYLCLIYTFLSSFKTFGFFPIFAGLFYLQVLKTSIIKIIEDPLKVFKVEKKNFSIQVKNHILFGRWYIPERLSKLSSDDRNLFYDDIFIKNNSAMRETDITLDTKNILRQFLTAILPLSIHVCIKHQWGENTHTHTCFRTHTQTHPGPYTRSPLPQWCVYVQYSTPYNEGLK
jgi:hypothetical protein